MGSSRLAEQSYRELIEEIMEKAHECMLVTDENGIILLMNQRYREFVGKDHVVGQHVTEVIENTRMHIVGKTGKAEIAEIQRIQGHDMIANRVPIIRDGKVVAVFGTVFFQDIKELYALTATVDHLQQELAYYKRELRQKMEAAYRFDQITTLSPAMLAVKQLAKKVAATDSTVLITGESGTGKELFAHAIHAASHRELGPFIKVNCAAIPDALLESEMFGYEEGAFTGASRKGKKGRFELAHHGTLLLDEIGDMPLSLQVKLLRVLQEKEVERVGGTRPIAVDVRVIASTNRNLTQLIQEGKFREDLYYRLNVVTLEIPPLRERKEDLPLLVHQLLEQLVESVGIEVEEIHADAWTELNRYAWPGNVRELRNVLERAFYLMEGTCLKAEHLHLRKSITDKTLHLEMDDCAHGQTLKEILEQAERNAILQALKHANGNKLTAAKALGISKSGFYHKLDKYSAEESKYVE